MGAPTLGQLGILNAQRDGREKAPESVPTPAGPQGGDLSALFDVAGIDNTETLKLTGELDKQINLRLNQLNNLPTLQERFGEKRGNRFARRLDKVFGGQGTTERMFQEKIQTKLLGEVIQLSREKRQLMAPAIQQTSLLLKQIGDEADLARKEEIAKTIERDFPDEFHPAGLLDFRTGGDTTLVQAKRTPEQVDLLKRGRSVVDLINQDNVNEDTIIAMLNAGYIDEADARVAIPGLISKMKTAQEEEAETESISEMISSDTPGMTFERKGSLPAPLVMTDSFWSRRFKEFQQIVGRKKFERRTTRPMDLRSPETISEFMAGVIPEDIKDNEREWIEAGLRMVGPFLGENTTPWILRAAPRLPSP